MIPAKAAALGVFRFGRVIPWSSTCIAAPCRVLRPAFRHFRRTLGRLPPRATADQFRASSVDDVIPAVDVQGLSRDQAGRIMRKEGGGNAHVVDADETARRRLGFGFVQ